MTPHNLTDYLRWSATQWPERPAVVDPSGSILTYRQLDGRSDALAAFLARSGVKRGDRVGVVLPKCAAAVISLFGIMKAGAAYVPVDYRAPAERGRKILSDCQVSAIVVDENCKDLTPENRESPLCAHIVVGAPEAAEMSAGVILFDEAIASAGAAPDTIASKDELAYILYTSGSTGIPKGVMLTHENAISFVEWCASVFTPTEQDRFSSHAPFHFDLSILDLYVAIKHGAAVYLISEELGKSPKDLAKFIAANRLTVWYSTPSILTLLTQFGALDQHDCSSLRLVLFAGEVFPVKHLRNVLRLWPAPVYYNLYGPTETNVCTFARIPSSVPEDRDVPFPIGFPCSHCEALLLDPDGQEVETGEEGLLYIAGPSVFPGYWNRPVENAKVFLERNEKRWYNTGDVVRWAAGEGYIYVGRRDRMVKRRGYRIELGEIERALYLHERVREAAVISIPDADSGVKITGFLSCHGAARPSVIDLKIFCSKHLPSYMVPDLFVLQERLPRTSTDKVDYQTLKQQVLAPGVVVR